jgi:hypothetical protein
MAEQKTKPTDIPVRDFLAGVESEEVRKDCRALIKMMKEITGSPARMWGPSIIGFGKYHYKYASGHEGDAPLAAFSPRKGNLTIYTSGDFPNRESLLKSLGKAKTSKGCIYIKKLEDINMDVLKKIVKLSYDKIRKTYPDK